MKFDSEKLRRGVIGSGNTSIALYGSTGWVLCLLCEIVCLAYGARHYWLSALIALGSVVHVRLALRFATQGPLPFMRNALPFIAMQVLWLVAAVLIFAQWSLPF